MFSMADVFELVVDGLNYRPLFQQHPFLVAQCRLLHISPYVSDQLYPITEENVAQGFGDVALVSKKPTEDFLSHTGDDLEVTV